MIAMAYDPRDPDSALVALFKHAAVKNEAKSNAAGRPIFDDVEMCEIRAPGSKDVKVFPAMALSAAGWLIDPYTGEQKQITYAERFARQYRQFKEHAAQTKTGTPLSQVPFLTEARKSELRALNLYTAEQLAAIDGQELKNLGPGGRELKNKAAEYIEDAVKNVPNIQMQAELEALRARNEMLEQDNATLTQRRSVAEAQLDEMTDAELHDYIKTHTGVAPVGASPHKTLVRMALEARPSKAA
jgi:hypothetical protein